MALSTFYMKTLFSWQWFADISPDFFPAGRFLRGHLAGKYHQILFSYFWFLLMFSMFCMCFITFHWFSSKNENFVAECVWLIIEYNFTWLNLWVICVFQTRVWKSVNFNLCNVIGLYLFDFDNYMLSSIKVDIINYCDVTIIIKQWHMWQMLHNLRMKA